LRSAQAILLLQTLGEFSHVALRKESIPVEAVLRQIDPHLFMNLVLDKMVDDAVQPSGMCRILDLVLAQ